MRQAIVCCCVRHGQAMSERHTLTVHNLGRSVGGAVLHSGISFQIESGEVLFIRGPSGVSAKGRAARLLPRPSTPHMCC